MTDDYTTTEGEAEQPQRKPNRRAWLRKIEGETAAHKEWREQAKDAECAYQGKPSPEGKPAFSVEYHQGVRLTKASGDGDPDTDI